MLKIDKWIDNKVVQNLFIWFFVFVLLMSTIQSDDRVLASFFALSLLAPAVYVNNLIILPYFRKNWLVFFLLFTLNTVIFTGISVYILQFVLASGFEWSMFFNFLGIMILALAFASAIKFARDSFAKKQQEKEAELKLLKAQLNPHFLFNTLNNLYGLSVVKSDKLPSLMLKLSDLLRYSLYETKETFVTLEKEITYLQNYIALERIRLEDQTEIKLVANSVDESTRIAPMLLIVFVENAFKHLNISAETKSRVDIILEVKNDVLYFNCINSFDKSKLIEENMEKGRSGIGLQNAKKRLSLIYPEKHTLDVVTKNNEYMVSLTLSLT